MHIYLSHREIELLIDATASQRKKVKALDWSHLASSAAWSSVFLKTMLCCLQWYQASGPSSSLQHRWRTSFLHATATHGDARLEITWAPALKSFTHFSDSRYITSRSDDHLDCAQHPIHSSLSRAKVLHWILLARRTRVASYCSFSAFTKELDQRVGGRRDVFLTSHGIQLPVGDGSCLAGVRVSVLCGRPT